jgi:uncharacterized protein YndB with AHSA1/START domain
VRPVRFGVPAEVAFDYLVEPRNRPRWQSSLSRVEDVRGEVGVGQSWVDVTKPGLRPRMETTELDRPRRWTERGTWRRFGATLTLTFEPVRGGCDVGIDLTLDGRGVAAPLAALLTLVSPAAVRSDLRRAARLLGPHAAY